MKKFPTFSLSQAVPICLSKTIQLSKTFYKRKFATFLSFIAEKVSLCETAKWSKCDYSKQKFYFFSVKLFYAMAKVGSEAVQFV